MKRRPQQHSDGRVPALVTFDPELWGPGSKRERFEHWHAARLEAWHSGEWAGIVTPLAAVLEVGAERARHFPTHTPEGSSR